MKLQVGVKILIQNDQGEYLLLRRSEAVDHGGENVWDIPGGRIDSDEQLHHALQREVREETGLTLATDTTLLSAQDIIVEAKQLHVVRLTYRGQASGTIQLSHEHDKYEWMNAEELLQIKNLDKYLREVLEDV